MRLILVALLVSLTSILFSCKDAKELEHKSETPEINTDDSLKKDNNEISKVEMDSIIQRLQGNWKESEYPFRVAVFKDSLVRFIEEGIVEKPRFQEYRISGECPFEVNNLKNIGPEDLFLVMKEDGTCEKFKVSNNTLTLRGFNLYTGTEYHIVYKRAD